MASATILFYDYLLTLADEVSQAIDVALRLAYHNCERLNLLGMGRKRGVRKEHHLPYVTR